MWALASAGFTVEHRLLNWFQCKFIIVCLFNAVGELHEKFALVFQVVQAASPFFFALA